MAIRNILTDDDETLRKVSRVVQNFDKRLHILLDDMIETLRKAEGAGLAAPQVGVLRRVCIVEAEEGDTVELINPEILSFDGEQEGREGCLSLPGQLGVVKRPLNVTVKAQDRYGKTFTVSGSELKARAIFHEIDHLNGILYTDIAERMVDLSETERED